MKTAYVHTWALRVSALVLALSMGAGECIAEGRAGLSIVTAAVTLAVDLTGRWDGARSRPTTGSASAGRRR